MGFQDGASIAFFTKTANGRWRVRLGGEPSVCAEVVFFPRAVLAAWRISVSTAGFDCGS